MESERIEEEEKAKESCISQNYFSITNAECERNENGILGECVF